MFSIISLIVPPLVVTACLKRDSNKPIELAKWNNDIEEYFLKVKEQTSKEIIDEDNLLLKKYKKLYNVKNSYDIDTSYKHQETLEDSDSIVIFLDGGPWLVHTVEKRNKMISKVKEKYPNYDWDSFRKDGYITFGSSYGRYGEWTPVKSPYADPYRGDLKINYFDNYFGSMENILEYNDKLNKTNNKAKISSLYFIESQHRIINELYSRFYSLNELIEIQKMNAIMLHQVIQHFHSKNKKVYVLGSSFGGELLYTYLTRYGNDTEGMIVDGSPLNTSNGALIEFDGYDGLRGVNSVKAFIDYKWGGIAAKTESIPASYANATHQRFMYAANYLSNSKIISKLKLDKKTLFLQADNDHVFNYHHDGSVPGSDIYPWTFNNIRASGGDYRYLKGASHTSVFYKNNKWIAPYLMVLMANNIDIPKINTWYLFEKNVEKRYF